MSFARILGIIGALLGIPGFLLLFFNGDAALGAAVLLLACVCVFGAWFWNLQGKLPPFTFKATSIVLTLEEPNGAGAMLEKQYKIKPRHHLLTTLTHRHISADGDITDICWDGVPVPADCIREEIREYEIDIKFPGPLKRGKEFPGKLSYRLANSFPAEMEGFVYFADFPTKITDITVHLPAGRVCKKAMAFKTTGAGRTPFDEPTVSEGGRKICLEVKKPSVGSEYSIMWYW